MNKLELRLSVIEDEKLHLEAFVDGEALARRETEEIEIPFALLPSIDRDGDYFFVSCECGDAGCAGYLTPTTVRHDGDLIHWADEELGWDFTFERSAYAGEIRRVIDDGRSWLAGGNLQGNDPHLSNIKFFRNELREETLSWDWDYGQMNARELRLRDYLWENDPEEFERVFRREQLHRVAREEFYRLNPPAP